MKDIIILGCGMTHHECTYDTEVWGVNATVRWAEKNGRLDKLFFFDDLATFSPNVMTAEEVVECKAELITTEKNVKFLKQFGREATIYPLEEILQKFKTHYFMNSIAYMIAYAMYQGDIDMISMYGIDHMNWGSYAMERTGVEYWVGRAEGAGIKVWITPGSALRRTLDGKLYGYDFFYENRPMSNKLSDKYSSETLMAA